MSTLRKHTSLVVLSVCLSAAIGCNQAREPRTGSSTLRIGILQHGSSIPLIVAYERGLFKKRGIDVQLTTLTADQHMPSLLKGDVDVISPSSFPVIFSTFQQNPGTIQCYLVGGESKTGDVLYGMVVRKDTKYASLGDLVGKTIGSASKFTTVNLRNVLRHKFHDRAQATTVREFGDRSLLITGLQNGTLDAAVVDQPALSSTVFQDGFRVIEKNFRAEYLFEPYWSGSGVASTAWVKANRGKYESYLDAIDDALRVCKEDSRATKESFIRHFSLKEVRVDAIGMYVYPNARFVPQESFVGALMKMLVENRLLAAEFDARELFYRR
ncbi:MAG: ABC transporter substrate-binding protein [Acidobacteriota bacterium]